MIFRPTESSRKIVDFYRNYLLTTFTTSNSKYNEQLRIELEKDKAIADGPYISMTDPYEKGASLPELCDEGILSKEILKMNSFHPERKLYKHQEEAIRTEHKHKNLIVTTGTGSGKTESFLIPVINELLREKEEGTLCSGVRTLIIYPMNALVNDQIRRIREILSDYPDCGITFGKFTGETKNSYKDAIQKYEDNNDKPLENCELISREEMRDTPPNILITNYAMLEYMLLRPGDNVIFSDINAKYWKYIVFDEAHSYTGAKGIEVGTLVKRIKAMLERDDIQFILTSATLGDENSNKEIIEFGKCLCDAKFDDSCIIRSRTVEAIKTHDLQNVPFDFYTELSEMIRNEASDDEKLEYIKKIAICFDGDDYPSAIFDIVLHDKFYTSFRRCLLKQIKSVVSICSDLSISSDFLTDFITVASSAHRNGEKLFEVKYHMFIRGIEGVYVTLKPNEKLFIHNMDSYYDVNDGYEYKAFQISFCSNCNALFIPAEEIHHKLVQRSKFSDEYKPNVYLLSEEEFEEDDGEIDNGENIYYVCSRCGEIKHTADQLKCGHGMQYAVKLRQVKKSGEALHKCPCCHSVDTHRSIVRPYYLGSEAATSVIATALYNELPGKIVVKGQEKVKKGLFGKQTKVKTEDRITYLSKQFLAFSDNRQAAAFFSSYLQYTYNATIVKRIMSDIINTESKLGLYDFVNLLSDNLKKYNIKLNSTSYKEDAWVYTLREISNFKAKNSLLSLGIMQADIDLHIEEGLEDYNLSLEETTAFFNILIRNIVHDAAFNVNFKFTEADWENISVVGFRRLYVKDPNSTSKKILIPWLTESKKSNKILKQVIKFLGLEENDARKLLEDIWEFLFEYEIINQIKIKLGHQEIAGYALNCLNDNVIITKPKKLYKCNECQKISPYNFRNLCENPACSGHLIEYDASTSNTSKHYRDLYTKLDITPMRVEEHTAQLAPTTAAEYQNDFKDKKINVLSCSTTFEMGVDVGSLETVFMRNMPPTPANYAQRAGRAGRSFYSAAYALTYCPNSSHDLNYFKNPVQMINGTIRPPYFNMENHKIVLRHMVSSALSYFWREYPETFEKKIGNFMEIKGFGKFKDYLYKNPIELKEYLYKVVPKNLWNYFDIENFGWVNRIFKKDEETDIEMVSDAVCDIAVAKYNDEYESLKKERENLYNKHSSTGSVEYSIKTLENQNIIEFLSKNNIIPKYGFPVDTVELYESIVGSQHPLRLNRDLFTAISEYAPGSQVVANGRLLTSRYIKKLKGYDWPKYKYITCSKCNTLNATMDLSSKEMTKCRQCGQKLSHLTNVYLIPKFGFIAEKDEKPVNTNKPERTYHGAISYTGDDKKISFKKYEINGQNVFIGNSRMDKLLVLNEAPFFVCQNCGYTRIESNLKFKNSIEDKKQHRNSLDHPCINKRLYRYSLGHEFKTDVILIQFPDYILFGDDDQGKAWSILYSMLEGLSRCLNIDRNEVSGCLQWYKPDDSSEGNYSFVLFDNTPGGAGYVRQLENMDVFENMLREGYSVVNSCDCGGDKKDTSCYGCLRNYYNQRQHDILKRKYALDFYENLFCNSDNFNVELIETDTIYEENTNSESIVEKNDNSFAYKLNLSNGGSVFHSIEDLMDAIIDIEDYGNVDELNLLQKIKEKLSKITSDSIHRGVFKVLNSEFTDDYYATAIWKEKKVMLFTSEYEEDYEIAKQSDWNCFFTGNDFNLDEFIEMIRR